MKSPFNFLPLDTIVSPTPPVSPYGSEGNMDHHQSNSSSLGEFQLRGDYRIAIQIDGRCTCLSTPFPLVRSHYTSMCLADVWNAVVWVCNAAIPKSTLAFHTM